MAADHSAALDLTNMTRFTKRLTIVSFSEFSGSSKNCVSNARTKVSHKLKYCCHGETENTLHALWLSSDSSVVAIVHACVRASVRVAKLPSCQSF